MPSCGSASLASPWSLLLRVGIGSVGDSQDHAFAETINGLFKAKVIHRRRPWRSFETNGFATLKRVDGFNHRGLMQPFGEILSPEAEERCYAKMDEVAMAA